MKRTIVPVALFLTLVLSVALLPPASSVVVVSIAGFVASLGALAWWVLWADRRPPAQAPAPAEAESETGGYLGDDWESFERAFWAHVAEHEATSDLD